MLKFIKVIFSVNRSVATILITQKETTVVCYFRADFQCI